MTTAIKIKSTNVPLGSIMNAGNSEVFVVEFDAANGIMREAKLDGVKELMVEYSADIPVLLHLTLYATGRFVEFVDPPPFPAVTPRHVIQEMSEGELSALVASGCQCSPAGDYECRAHRAATELRRRGVSGVSVAGQHVQAKGMP